MSQEISIERPIADSAPIFRGIGREFMQRHTEAQGATSLTWSDVRDLVATECKADMTRTSQKPTRMTRLAA